MNFRSQKQAKTGGGRPAEPRRASGRPSLLRAMAEDYAARQPRFGLADLSIVAAAAAEPTTIFLDVRAGLASFFPFPLPFRHPHNWLLAAPCMCQVRSDGEVADSPLPNGKPFVHCPVTMADTSQLEAQAEDLLPDKSATILCFCGVGGRVIGAKAVLEGLGYTGVLNAGGLKDLVAAGVV